jgi:hypothetical protein
MTITATNSPAFALALSGHDAAAAAAKYNDAAYAPFFAEMTAAQASVISKIAMARKQGVRPYVCERQVVVATEEMVAPYHQTGPVWYWTAIGKNWKYTSCTGHTTATVFPDGRVIGKTRTNVGRMGWDAQPWKAGDPTPAGVVTTAQAVVWALAAETLETLTPREASFAMAMGAPEWTEWTG